MNKFIAIGRSTKDVELKYTTSNTALADFSIAVKRTFKNADGEYDSDFFNCIAFGKLAETISKYVRKGDMVGIEGRVQTRNYTNKEGEKRYVTEIVIENIDFLQPKKQSPDVEFEVVQDEADPFANVDPFANEDVF